MFQNHGAALTSVSQSVLVLVVTDWFGDGNDNRRQTPSRHFKQNGAGSRDRQTTAAAGHPEGVGIKISERSIAPGMRMTVKQNADALFNFGQVGGAGLMNHLIAFQKRGQNVHQRIVNRRRALRAADDQNNRRRRFQFEELAGADANRQKQFFANRIAGDGNPGASRGRKVTRRFGVRKGNPDGEFGRPEIDAAGLGVRLVDENRNFEPAGGEEGRETVVAAFTENQIGINQEKLSQSDDNPPAGSNRVQKIERRKIATALAGRHAAEF